MVGGYGVDCTMWLAKSLLAIRCIKVYDTMVLLDLSTTVRLMPPLWAAVPWSWPLVSRC